MILREYLRQQKDIKSGVNLFFDIETYQYNKREGRKKPSKFKNHEYIVSLSYYESLTSPITIIRYPTFKECFQDIFKALKGITVKKINLLAHNSNKFDNHYLMTHLRNTYPDITYGSAFLRQAVDQSAMITKKSLSSNDDYILEKRVKSKTNLDIDFSINNINFSTIDTYPKSGNLSLKKLGENMQKMGIISKDELKQNYVYDLYDSDDDIDDPHAYAIEIFNSMTQDQLKYTDNDVILIAEFWRNYSKIYPSFDRSKMTFSQNVFEKYKTNPMACYQLTNKVDKLQICYTDYVFNGINFYDYIKRFYKGGLNIYNDRYIGKVIEGHIRSFDLNSSYPNVMYNSKIPTFVVEHDINGTYDLADIDDDNYFYLIEVTINNMNNLINHVDSEMIKKALVKYYATTEDNYYINSNTLRMIKMFSSATVEKIDYVSLVKWECHHFGARNVISDCYFDKAQGKLDTRIIMNNPSDITITDEKGDFKLNDSQIGIAKVTLNGIYGLPALRAFYNVFTYDNINDVIDSHPNGFKNNERNLIFSTFVTSQAFINLLKPLQHVPPKLIDEHFYYADTDSLYIDNDIAEYIPDTMIDKYNLGFWDNEHNMKKFYILNHKKYAFLEYNKKKERDEINFRCGGIPKSNFDTSVTFDDFIKNQFSNGVVKKGTRSYLADDGTIAVYDADIKLEQGSKYPIKFSRMNKLALDDLKKKILASLDDNDFDQHVDDVLYVETTLGSLGMNDLTDIEYDTDVMGIDMMMSYTNIIKRKLKDDD